MKNRRNERQEKNRKRKLRALRLLKRLMGPCARCGIKYHPAVMHFHHKDPSQKLENVSDMLRGYSWEMIVAEVRKCELICANCHALETEQAREAA